MVADTAFINVNLAGPETSSLNVPVIPVNICIINCASQMPCFSKTMEELTGPWLVWHQGDCFTNPGFIRGLPIPDHKAQLTIMLTRPAGCCKKQTRKHVTRKHQQIYGIYKQRRNQSKAGAPPNHRSMQQGDGIMASKYIVTHIRATSKLQRHFSNNR